MKLGRLLGALIALILRRLTRRGRDAALETGSGGSSEAPADSQPGDSGEGYTAHADVERAAGKAAGGSSAGAEHPAGEESRIVPEEPTARGAENVVLALLALATLFALGFIVVYGVWSPADQSNELLGLCLAGSLGAIGAALTVVAKRLVVTEELEDDYPQEHTEDQRVVAEIVRESGSRMTRKKLLLGAGVATGGALGAAVVTPALSLGPFFDTGPLDHSPWKPGTRLVDENGAPVRADAIETGSMYTAFPEGADPELIGSPLVVVRVDVAALRLPAARVHWAPEGILAYSKICTHAGCAIALYRKPLFSAVEPAPALVCPCHYSTFDPASGGTVTYGPAGRALPQLPLMIDGQGVLRAGGNYSQRVGPSWGEVREPPKS